MDNRKTDESIFMRNENGPQGLKNNGQNSCFMNAVIQSLWNISAFSNKICSIEKHKCSQDYKCVFCALQIIFTSLKYSSEVVDSIGLRCALDALNSNFAMKKMADASEAFIYILDEIHKATEVSDSGFNCCSAHEMFSIDILSLKLCPCGYCSDDIIHTREWTLIIPGQYVVDEHNMNRSKSFAKILGDYEKGGCLKCNGCGKVTLSPRLDFDPKLPEVLTINVIWDYSPNNDTVNNFVKFIPQEFNINDIADDANATYVLRGLVVFYGKHYYTYFYKLRDDSYTVREWKMFDDSVVKSIGEWDKLTTIMTRGHIQPVLIFYVKK